MEELREDPSDGTWVASCDAARLLSRRQTNSLERKTGALALLLFPLWLPGAPSGSCSATFVGTLKLQLAHVSP